ncbi:1-acyl-sn-glycerol-3-phosphate acyltransferase [Pseudooceanicola sediminis]|uniref:1-acyl-sn-glycerol-3-phosphate acyltransferase n=1 Tax=Pseudooceanicola sediminis TaxID=2211117 RepID=A0A399J549_9RHOB|nr:lysophospholipid acyltransferase family protein [Pseudooceanicola sediminis]KAA2316961.1 1-acyl-sn-glycerol-3-phosphate acyltransferase [Puniceibacterium sp. HSS470]RII40588.1 1-acyl-sn-glycerol-3-phosphate acyltransferase [Pseudooceanicola sediminis]
MSETWTSDQEPQEPKLDAIGWVIFCLRAVPFALICFIGLIVLLLVRLFERPLCGLNRPVTPYLQQGVCKAFFAISGIRLRRTGSPMQGPGAVVVNHSSWLDIFTLSAPMRVFFVSKAEVRSWPGIGTLARATGTLFINRDRREAKVQQRLFFDRLLAGHNLLFFPEGTSTDGRRVLPFKSTLFGAFFDPALRDRMQVQPVSVIYRAPEGADPRFYGWWGDMSFAGHLAKVLGARRQGMVEVIYHAPIKVADHADRKALARACEDAVRGGMPWDFQISR